MVVQIVLTWEKIAVAMSANWEIKELMALVVFKNIPFLIITWILQYPWLRVWDSNRRLQEKGLACYHYTNPPVYINDV